ncbi:MAG: hypothetical protein ABIK33_05395 [candidate division WOR-3 bacterium]
MRNIIFGLLLTLSIILAQPMPEKLAIADEPPDEPEFASKHPGQMMETIRVWRLTEILNLTEDQSVRFFPKIKELQKAREEFEQKRIEISSAIEDLLKDAKKYEKELKAKIQEFEQYETKLHEKEKQLRKEIANILTPEQQAKFMLFQMRFNREMREMIKEMRERKGEMKRKLRERFQEQRRKRWQLW